jgi:hypothetical protein
MIKRLFLLSLLLISPALCRAQDATPAATVIPVKSPAFVFSPGNWAGDEGRGGALYRQSWNSGAYFRVSWTTTGTPGKITLLLDTSVPGAELKNLPNLTYNIDGTWKGDVPYSREISIAPNPQLGAHTLTVYLQSSPQADRWGTQGTSAANGLRVTGLRVEGASAPLPSQPRPKWALEIGDSITEGIGTDGNLSDYSYFVGQALHTQGYEYCVSACGYSGWICKGDGTRDVPAYYSVAGSLNGEGGTYDDAASRWNKIDANHSLLDAKGHLSAYGQTGQAPSVITINYGTNEAFSQANVSDLQASITQGLTALRQAAPDAQIFLIIPFGQMNVKAIGAALKAYQSAHPKDKNVSLINLGPGIAQGLADNGYWGGVHPNLRGHATFAAQILAALQARLKTGDSKN